MTATFLHTMVRITDPERSRAFYEALGFRFARDLDIVRNGEKEATNYFFSLGDHHNFAVMEAGGGEGGAADGAAGLHHVAFKIGDTLDELREAKAKLEAAGVMPAPIDHEVTKSLYFADPDGNGVELYVDASDVWKRDPQRVAQIAPLAL